jgi:glutamate---cysteine ligase / carboxylate-amine ligase
MTVRTVGVEEEFLLLREGAPRLAGEGGAVVEAAKRIDPDGQFEHELKMPQAELGSSATQSLDQLAADLRALRGELATASAKHGVRLVASGTSPVAGHASTTAEQRYLRMSEEFGLVARQQLTCGMHIHVSVESPEEGVAVIDRIGPWLALLTALSANSPIYSGRDTDYASYRSILWRQWPTSGSTATFADRATYARLTEDLKTAGAATDDGMIYFDARLSAKYPTVEIRVCDVCASSSDAVVIAGLARALVQTEAGAWRAGSPAPSIRPELLRATAWRAARWGMGGELVDLGGSSARPRPALVGSWDLVDALLEHVMPSLELAGDLDRVSRGLAEIRRRGTGADRQRAAYADGSRLADVIDAVAVSAAADES